MEIQEGRSIADDRKVTKGRRKSRYMGFHMMLVALNLPNVLVAVPSGVRDRHARK